MNVLLVHSPGAGEDAIGREELESRVRGGGHEVRYFEAKDDSWRDAFREGPEVVAAAGGDGTVRIVALATRGTGVPVAVLPMGTANNIARALAVSDSIQHAVAEWDPSCLRRIDVGVASWSGREEAFLESFGGGALARLIERHRAGPRRERSSRRSGARLKRALAELDRVLAEEPTLRVAMRADGRALAGDVLLVEVMNLRRVGANLPLAPAADPSDGLLDLVRAGEEERESLRRYVAARLEHSEERLDLPSVQASAIELSIPDDFPVHLDDVPRSVPAGETVRIRVEPGAVRFFEGGPRPTTY